MSLVPDSPLARRVAPSPNHGERRFPRPDMLILHYTGMAGGAAALARLRDPLSEVSAHYLVFEDGGIVQMVPEAPGTRAGVPGRASPTSIPARSASRSSIRPMPAGCRPTRRRRSPR